MVPDQSLPDILPADPMPLVAEWLAEALRRNDQPNPNAMVLATCDSQNRPAARVVLAKEVDTQTGTVRFVTNYESRKGRELEHNPRAALVMHWDHLHRQVRIEGYVRRAAATESDAYFESRARASQLGAHASAQSRPVASRDALQAQLDAVMKRYPAGTPVPRPPRSSRWATPAGGCCRPRALPRAHPWRRASTASRARRSTSRSRAPRSAWR